MIEIFSLDTSFVDSLDGTRLSLDSMDEAQPRPRWDRTVERFCLNGRLEGPVLVKVEEGELPMLPEI